MTSPRDTYLAWQADIGTEEVVLVSTWVRRVPPTSSPAHAGTQAPPPRTGTQFETSVAGTTSVPAGPAFFSAIAEELAKPEPLAARGRSKAVLPSTVAPATGSPPPSALTPFAAALKALTDLDAYWHFLDAEYPVLFPGVSAPVTRASGHASPRLALVELAPTGGVLFGGAAGVLLDRMMNAIGLTRDQLYLTSVMKTAPAGRSWARKDTARMIPALLRELSLARCDLVLLLGEPCAQAVLKTGRSLDALAGTAETVEGTAFAATWHPVDLLADESRKKPAWEQLKWLQTRLPRTT
jgi:uracil-DNA glycosylase family 4